MSHSMANRPDKLLELFGRHFVGLVLEIERRSLNVAYYRRFHALSGMLLSISPFTFYLTAGHSLRKIRRVIDDPAYEIKGSRLADIFGVGKITGYPIPFDIASAPMYYIEDDDLGLDFGVIALSDYYVDLLAANHMIALFEDNWASQHTIHYDAYILLGLPEAFMSEELTASGELSLSPVLLVLEPILQPDSGIPIDEKGRFHAKMKDTTIDDIGGMSGGPIFGISIPDPLQYWIVAIQSSWFPLRREIFGCPIQTICGVIMEEVRKAQASSE